MKDVISAGSLILLFIFQHAFNKCFLTLFITWYMLTTLPFGIRTNLWYLFAVDYKNVSRKFHVTYTAVSLQYSLPVINGISWSNMRDLDRVEAQALHACPGVPCKTSNVETVWEKRVTFLSVLRVKETVHGHVRHISSYREHQLTSVIGARPFSSFSAVLALLQGDLLNNIDASANHFYLPLLHTRIAVKPSIPGIK